jgi:hypothetical protein
MSHFRDVLEPMSSESAKLPAAFADAEDLADLDAPRPEPVARGGRKSVLDPTSVGRVDCSRRPGEAKRAGQDLDEHRPEEFVAPVAADEQAGEVELT